MKSATSTRGLERAKDLSQDRSQRCKELKQTGHKIIGYMCPFAPPEIIEASGAVPYRICGDPATPALKVDQHMESNTCPWVRNCFNMALEGRYGWLDGLTLAHSCDAVQMVYGLWKYYASPSFTHYVNVAHTLTPATRQFYREELVLFQNALQRFTGNEVTPAKLQQAIDAYDEMRALVRGVYQTRKSKPPAISGSEMTHVLLAISSIPVTEAISLLKDVKAEIAARPLQGSARPRFMVHGSIIDNAWFVELLENAGADVVLDDTCIGTRSFWHQTKRSGDPLEDLVEAWFDGFLCPRTYRGTERSRFDYMVKMARDYSVDGIVMHMLRFCDPHMCDLPDARDHLEQAGLPVLALEDDYTTSADARIKTRIQAFMEMIG